MFDLKKLDLVASKPGIYLWKDVNDNIIYVGKAKNLQTRMKQYFRGMQNSYKTQKLVSLIEDFDYIITSSDHEALILERNLIEKHAPQFNILLLDDKRYPYIKVELKEKLEVKMVFRVRSERQKALYLGPFPTGYGARNILNLITRLVFYEKGLPIKDASYDSWKVKYDYIKTIFSVSNKDLIKMLEAKMAEAAEAELYEIAHDLKESIMALDFYRQRQTVELTDHRNIDVIVFVDHQEHLSIALLFYRQGLLLSKKEMIIEVVLEAKQTANEFVRQYYNFNVKPQLIISNMELEVEMPLLVPQKGIYVKLVEMAQKNAVDNFDLKLKSFLYKKEITSGALQELENLINLKPIYHIIMFDNSTTNNQNPVSVVVSYKNGVKVPGEYRKFPLDNLTRQGDVAYMEEGARRYFAKDYPHPDLIIADGSQSQIRAIKKVVQTIPIIGLVKNEKHLTDRLIDLKGAIHELKPGPLYNMLASMQTEVDRYAKSYHGKKTITTLEGKLISVKGLGPKMEQKLLDYFKTYAAIYNASLEELSKVVPLKVANEIKNALKSNEELW